MAAENITAITQLDRSKYKTKVFSGGHLLYADEPLEMGGTDEGMNPYALLLASLGSCTAITIRMYADHKNYPLETICVELAMRVSTDTVIPTRITTNIVLTGALTEDERSRLMLMANKCPVHKLLSNSIIIEQTTEH
jgi:putative redox protein